MDRADVFLDDPAVKEVDAAIGMRRVARIVRLRDGLIEKDGPAHQAAPE